MQTHKLMRTVVLAIVSLALACLLFAIYQYSETPSTPVAVATGEPTPSPTPSPTPTATPKASPPKAAVADNKKETVSALRIGSEQFPVTGGKRVNINIYEPDGRGRQRAQVQVDEWKPVGDDGNEFEVLAPVIHLRTPRGQLIKISGDKGVVVLKSGNPRAPDPKSGRLIGNVRIIVDRLTNAQRTALSEDQPDTSDDGRFIKLFMDDLLFDLEFARIETTGPFRVESAEATIKGNGLLLHYDELDSRIEELVIEKGGMIELRGMGNRFAFSLSSDPKRTSPADESQPDLPSDEPPSAPVADDVASAEDEDDLIVLDFDKTKPSTVHPTDVYTAVFSGDVDLKQYSQAAQIGRLVADQLEILFDFSQRERDLAGQATASTSKDDGNTNARDGASQDAAAQSTPEDRVLLIWNDRLKVTSERAAEDRSESATQRVRLTATGEKVRVADSQRRIECRKLVYHDDTGRVQLFGTADEPAYVASDFSDDVGQLWGTEILLDRHAGHAHVKGPGGRLLIAGAGDFAMPSVVASTGNTASGFDASETQKAPFDARFDTDLIATFGEVAWERVDPKTGEVSHTTKQVLQNAVFSGNVDMVHGQERIQCGSIDMNFDLSKNGELAPTDARAYDNVRVSQGKRYIVARDRMIVDLEMIEVEKPPFDPVKAKQIAASKGHSPDDLDWAAIRADYESKKDYRPGLKRLKAYGGVEVRDPDQRLEIDCVAIDCVFSKDGRIESGLVTPEDSRQARVVLGEFSIMSYAVIPFDVPGQATHVDGPGNMTFLASQDLDGRKLDEPTLVHVKWTRRMAFDGPGNEASFNGNVHIETVNSTYDCSDLRIDFEDRMPPPDKPERKTGNAPIEWWIFTPLIARVAGDESNRDERFAAASSAFSKDPVYLYATGGAKALTWNTDPESGKLRNRVHVSGPTMAIDLRKKYFFVEGAGNLLIEDYKAKPKKDKASATPNDSAQITPFGQATGNEPSQTYVAWEGSMNYRYGINVVEFDDHVALVHRTGSRMKLAERILDGNQQQAGKDKGREAKLTCQSLVAEFLQAGNDGEAGAGRMSGNDVKAFNASGQVYFTDSGVSVIAHQITYTRQDGVLQILGTDSEPAQLFDQRTGFREFRGPAFYWDRTTNQIKAPRSRGSAN